MRGREYGKYLYHNQSEAPDDDGTRTRKARRGAGSPSSLAPTRPDPPVLDPHVLVPLEGLTIEDCEVALCVAPEGLARVWFPVVPACIWRTHEVEFEDFRTWE